MEGKITIMFGVNGNTGVFDDEGQMPDLQTPYILLFAEFLNSKGVDPLDVIFKMPNGETVELFSTPNGYNWRLLG